MSALYKTYDKAKSDLTRWFIDQESSATRRMLGHIITDQSIDYLIAHPECGPLIPALCGKFVRKIHDPRSGVIVQAVEGEIGKSTINAPLTGRVIAEERVR